MASRKNKINGKEIVKMTVIVAIIATIGGYLLNRLYFRPLPEKYIETPPNIPELMIYKSDMGFSVIVPKAYEVEEGEGEVVFATNEGDMRISRNINFIKDNFVESKELDVNGINMIRGFVNRKRIYIIDTPTDEFIVYTSQESLYDELDLIALSFRLQ